MQGQNREVTGKYWERVREVAVNGVVIGMIQDQR